MSFANDVRAFADKVDRRLKDAHAGVTEECFRSMTSGSEITGAPGQPVGQYGPGYNEGKVGGDLLASYQLVHNGPFDSSIVSNSPYAVPIEEGMSWYGKMSLRSSVGGFHSRKLTMAGFDRIKNHVLGKIR